MWHQLRWRIPWERFDRAAGEQAARSVAERLELQLELRTEPHALRVEYRFDRDTALALAVVGDDEDTSAADRQLSIASVKPLPPGQAQYGAAIRLQQDEDADGVSLFLEVVDEEEKPNEVCWSSAVALADQVATALDAELLDDEEAEEELEPDED